METPFDFTIYANDGSFECNFRVRPVTVIRTVLMSLSQRYGLKSISLYVDYQHVSDTSLTCEIFIGAQIISVDYTLNTINRTQYDYYFSYL
jgi:hypothetical protein